MTLKRGVSLDFIPAVNQFRNLAKIRRFSSDEILARQQDLYIRAEKCTSSAICRGREQNQGQRERGFTPAKQVQWHCYEWS
jgi:hypothetical protein